MGYASKWTQGSILYTCVDRRLEYEAPNERTVRCENVSTNTDMGGDSGGPAILPVGGVEVYLAGVETGNDPSTNTNSMWSTISQIQLDYSNTLGVERIPSLSAPSIVATISGGHPVLNWSAVSGATKYNIQFNTGAGFSYLTTTASAPYTDFSQAVISVLAGPPAPGIPYVAYQSRSESRLDVSTPSNIVYFQKPAAISASIVGQSSIRTSTSCIWNANATGGTGSYSYAWKVNGVAVGSNSSQLLYKNTGSNFTLSVAVTDGVSFPATATLGVTVSGSAPVCQT